MMKSKNLLISLLLGAALLAVAVPVNAQFITIARKIKSMNTPSADIAYVIIDAGAAKVYQAVIDTLTTDPKFSVIKEDKSRNYVEFSRKEQKIAIQVDSLATGLSHLTVTAPVTGKEAQKPTDPAIDAIFKICEKAGVKCTIDNK